MMWRIKGEGKRLIHVLDGPDGPVTETKDMLNIASSYCKDLFSKNKGLTLG